MDHKGLQKSGTAVQAHGISSSITTHAVHGWKKVGNVLSARMPVSEYPQNSLLCLGCPNLVLRKTGEKGGSLPMGSPTSQIKEGKASWKSPAPQASSPEPGNIPLPPHWQAHLMRDLRGGFCKPLLLQEGEKLS